MTFTFVWSPEGRPIATYRTMSLVRAKAAFKRDFPAYAKYMGEVYATIDEPDANRLGKEMGEV